MPRAVWLLVVARAVNRLGAFSLPFLTLLLTQRYDASVEAAGLVMAAFGAATIPSRLAGGWLADRVGRRTTIVAGLVCCATAQLLLAGATSLPEAVVATVLLGLAFEIYESPSQAMIADVVASPDRAAAYGLMGAALALAGVGAGLLAAALGEIDLRLLFVADASTCLACAILVHSTLPSGRAVDVGHRRAAARTAGPWHDPLLLALLASAVCFAAIYLQIMFTLPMTLVDRGLAAPDFGLLLTASAVTIVAGQPLLGLCALRGRDPTAAMVAGYVLLACGLLAFGFVGSRTGFVVATVVWSLGDLLLLGRATALVTDLAPESMCARYLAVYGLGWGVAGVVAPLLGAGLLARLGANWLWYTCALVALALAAAQVMLRPAIVRRSSLRAGW